MTSEAANAFATKQRRRLSEGTQGGIFQLLQFEIVATHLGAASENVTLLIQDFKHIGSDGSGCFGSPRSILSQGLIQQFLVELKAFRNSEVTNPRSDRSELQSYSFDPVKAEDDAIENGYNDDGHMNFATQEPKGRQPRSPTELLSDAGKPYSIRPSDRDHSFNGIASDEPGQLRPGCRDSTMQSLVNEQLESLEKLETGMFSNTIIPAPKTSPKALLALLSNKPCTNDARSPPTISSEAMSLTKPATPSKGPVVSVRSNPKNTHAIDLDAIINDAVTEAQSALQNVIETSRSTNQGNRVYDSATNDRDRRGLSPPSLDVGALETVVDAEKNGQFTHGVDESNSNIVPKISATDPELVEDPWQGVTRIRRKDISISKSQQDLIERKDCWLPPESGVRRPIANLPMPILQSFTATIDGCVPQRGYDDRPKSSSTKSAVRSQTGSASPAIASRYASNDEDLQEIPFSSGEWPPSSPPTGLKRDQLPPDSSFSVSSPEALVNTEALSPQSDSTLISQEPVGTGIDSEILAFNGASEELDNVANQNEDAYSGHRQVTRNTAPSAKQALDSKSHVSLCKLGNDHEAVVKNFQSEGKCQEQEATDSKLPLPLKSDDLSLRSNQSNCPILSISNHGDGRIKSMVIDVDSDIADADSSQSEMETAIPGALQGYHMDVKTQQSHQTPPRNPDRHYPTLQVDRTPYTVQYQRKKQLFAGQHHPVGISDCSNENDDEEMTLSLVENASSAQIMVPGTFSPTEYMESAVDGTTCAFITSQCSTGVSRKEKITAQAMKNDSKTVKQETLGQGARYRVSNKREVEEIADTFSNITKRRKRQNCLSGSASEDEETKEDPSIKARQHRREFLNALRSLPHIAAAPLTPLPSDVDTKLYEDPKRPLSAQDRNDESGEHNQNEALSEQLSIGTHTLDEATSPVKAFSPAWPPVMSPHIQLQKRDDLCPLSPDGLATHPRVSDSPSLFDRFQHAYPQYKGNENHFVSMCRKVNALEKSNRMEHKSLWDDFVIRHQMEYRQYLLRCAEEAEDPMPYEMFYRKEIDGPKFTQRILKPDNIAQIRLIESETRAQSPVPLKFPVKTTIDLTHDEASDVEAFQKLSPKGVVLSKSAFLQPQEYTSEELKPEAPPDANHCSSVREAPRSLPRSETNHSISASASVEDKVLSSKNIPPAMDPTATSKKSRARIHVNPRVEAVTTFKGVASATRTSESILVVQNSPSGSRYNTVQSAQKSNIINNKTHRLVETSTVPPIPSGPTAKQLKSKVDLTSPQRMTGRNRINVALPSTSGSKPWYLDPVNPFKSFARAEASIKSGNGNGFVEDLHGRPIAGRPLVVKNGVVIAPKKRIDVLGWHI